MALGKIVIDLEAQYAAFTKGVHEVKEQVSELGESLETMKHLAEGAFAFVGIEAGASAVKEMVEHTMEGTAEAYRLSSALGITTKSLQELQTAGFLGAGIKADEFDGILQKMVKSLGAAETGTGPAAQALKDLGLSGDELKGQHLDQAFTTIAEKISEIKDPAEQARLATELFGREGQRLLPLFQQGSEGIRKAAEEADKFGVAMSDTDAAKVMQANEAYEKMGLAVQGIENQLVIALAPALEAILTKIESLAPEASKFQGWFTTAFKWVAEGIGYLIDAWHVLQLGGEAVSVALVASIEGIIWAVKELADGVIWVANKMGANWTEPPFFQNTINLVDDWRKNIQQQMSDTVEQLKHPSSEKWGEFFDQITADANDAAKKMADAKPMSAITADFTENAAKIKGILDKLKEQVADFGMTEAQKELAQLKTLNASQADQEQAAALAHQLDVMNQQQKVQEDINKLKLEAAQAGMTEAQKQADNLKRAGANDDQIKQANDLQQHIDAMKQWQDEQKEANKLIQDSMTPIEKYQKQLENIQKLYHDGLLSESQADDALAKALKELDKDKDGDAKNIGAETRRFDFRLPADLHKDDPAKQQLQVAKQTLQSQQKIEFYQEQQYNWGLADQQNESDEVADIYY